MTIAVVVLFLLVALCLLCIGHLTNQIAALTRRHEALVINVTHLRQSLHRPTPTTPGDSVH